MLAEHIMAVPIPQNLKYFPQTLATEFMLPNTRAVMLEISDFMLKKAEILITRFGKWSLQIIPTQPCGR